MRAAGTRAHGGVAQQPGRAAAPGRGASAAVRSDDAWGRAWSRAAACMGDIWSLSVTRGHLGGVCSTNNRNSLFYVYIHIYAPVFARRLIRIRNTVDVAANCRLALTRSAIVSPHTCHVSRHSGLRAWLRAPIYPHSLAAGTRFSHEPAVAASRLSNITITHDVEIVLPRSPPRLAFPIDQWPTSVSAPSHRSPPARCGHSSLPLPSQWRDRLKPTARGADRAARRSCQSRRRGGSRGT